MPFNEAFSDYNEVAIRGDAIRANFTFTSLDNPITDYKIWFYGKQSPNDADTSAIIKCSTENSTIIIIDAPEKVCQAIIPPSQTSSLTTKTVLFCEWQVELTASPGDVQTVLGGRGKITILLDIVRAS